MTSINVSLARPDAALPVKYVIGGSNSGRDGSSRAKIAGFYIQDQVEVIKAMAADRRLRYNSFKLGHHNDVAGGVVALLPSVAGLSSQDAEVHSS